MSRPAEDFPDFVHPLVNPLGSEVPPVLSDDEFSDEDWSLDSEGSLPKDGVDDFLLGESLDGAQTVSASAAVRRKSSRRKRRREAFSLSGVRSRSRKRKTAAAESKMTLEIETLMSNANHAFLEKNIPTAISLLEEVITKAPGLHDPFHLLGLIYEEELSDRAKALDYYFLAAQLVANDGELWRRVGSRAHELGCNKQAIYCYKKALVLANRAADKLDDIACYDLANIYLATDQVSKAVRCFERLLACHPGDPFLGRELARGLHKLDRLPEAIKILESCCCAPATNLPTPNPQTPQLFVYDPDVVNMLSEAYVEATRFEDCEKLLSNLISDHNLDSMPFELVVRLAASQLYAGGTRPPSSAQEFAFNGLLLPSTSRELCADLYLLLAEAYYHSGNTDRALALFMEVAALKSVRGDASVWVKIAKCRLRKESSCEAESAATAIQLSSDADLHVQETGARLILSQIIAKVGTGAAHQRIALLAMPSKTEEAGGDERSEQLPPPLARKARCQILQQLQSELPDLMDFSQGRTPAPPSDGKTWEEHRDKWISEFVRLVEDSELDLQRLLRHNMDRRLEQTELDVESQQTLLEEVGISLDLGGGGSRINDGTPTTSASEPPTEAGTGEGVLFQCFEDEGGTVARKGRARRRGEGVGSSKGTEARGSSSGGATTMTATALQTRIRAAAQYEPLEVVMGWKGYADLLEKGFGIVMRGAGSYRLAIELLEAISLNKRCLRTHQNLLDRQVFQQRLKRLSLQMAVEGGLLRIALSYVRERYLKRPDGSPKALQALGRLLFTGTFAHTTVGGLSTSLERETLLENRSWVIRQLLQRPKNYGLTMLTGHFCTLSGRWSLALAEYIRACQLLPREQMTILCLAVAFLNFATSRSVEDRHGTVLRGFATLSTYCRQRRNVTAKLAAASVAAGLKAVLKRQPTDAAFAKQLEEIVESLYKAETLYNYARAFHHLNIITMALPLYLDCLFLLPSAEKVQEISQALRLRIRLPSILTIDAAQLRFCASHNIALIFRDRRDLVQSEAFSMASITWHD